MATTTGTFVRYDLSIGHLVKEMNLGTDSFGILLTTSTYTPNAATHEFVSDITNELVGNGYSRAALTGVSVITIGPNGKIGLDANDPVFTASGGSLTARYWVLYNNTNATDATRPLLAYGLIDNTPADSVTTDGNTLTLQITANGLFTVG